MSYRYRYAVFVPTGRVQEAAAFAHEVFGDPIEVSADNFSVPIVLADGTDLRAGCGLIRDDQVAAVDALLPGAPWVLFLRWDLETGELVNTNVLAATARVGEPWSWEVCLGSLGAYG